MEHTHTIKLSTGKEIELTNDEYNELKRELTDDDYGEVKTDLLMSLCVPSLIKWPSGPLAMPNTDTYIPDERTTYRR